MEKLVTVCTFNFPAEAEAGKLLLEQKGIRAFLTDDNLVGMDWFLSNAVGGAKLQVAAADVAQAVEVLEQYRTSKTKTPENCTKEVVAFACHECGKAITFPAERRGHVETCPYCGEFVDVPEDGEVSTVAQSETVTPETMAGSLGARQSRILGSDSRTTSQIWIEVFAVLCLAYVPYMFYFVTGAMEESISIPRSFVSDKLWWIVDAIRISMPLLVIVALTRDPWSLFGIVRPRWITDALVGCAIGVCAFVFVRVAVSLLPLAMLERSASTHALDRAGPEGPLGYLLLCVACVVGAFAEEFVMRGYLIARLERLLRSTIVAVLVSTMLFASYHLYQGIPGAIGAGANGLVYGVAFCLFRRLWPICLAHALHNFVLYL